MAINRPIPTALTYTIQKMSVVLDLSIVQRIAARRASTPYLIQSAYAHRFIQISTTEEEERRSIQVLGLGVCSPKYQHILELENMKSRDLETLFPGRGRKVIHGATICW